jgi:hypothetical protein
MTLKKGVLSLLPCPCNSALEGKHSSGCVGVNRRYVQRDEA